MYRTWKPGGCSSYDIVEKGKELCNAKEAWRLIELKRIVELAIGSLEASVELSSG